MCQCKNMRGVFSFYSHGETRSLQSQFPHGGGLLSLFCFLRLFISWQSIGWYDWFVLPSPQSVVSPWNFNMSICILLAMVSLCASCDTGDNVGGFQKEGKTPFKDVFI